MFSQKDPRKSQSPLDQFTRMLEVGLAIFLGLIILAVLAGAIMIMLNMDDSSQSQGGRYYVVIGALVTLGFLDSQISRLVKRRTPLSLGVTRPARLYVAVSLLLMLIYALMLFTLAHFLP